MNDFDFIIRRLMLALVCASICAFAVLVARSMTGEELKRSGREPAAIAAVVGFLAYFFVLDQLIFGTD